MSRYLEPYQWIDTVVMQPPSLSKPPPALGLALWRFGMIIVRPCNLTAMADVLAPLLEGQSINTFRERLRESRKQRVELDVTECWAHWLA